MRLLRKTFGVATLLLLVGCSSRPEIGVRSEVDQNYVAKMEAVSVRNSQNVTIYWVNPPFKKDKSEAKQ